MNNSVQPTKKLSLRRLKKCTEIGVIGSCDYNTPDGKLTSNICEILCNYFPIKIIPLERNLRKKKMLQLPTGRLIKTFTDCDILKASIFVAPVWNAFRDNDFFIMPPRGLRYVYFTWYSDQLPLRTVQILNDRFDTVLVPNEFVRSALIKSGVFKPDIEILSVALGIENHLAQPLLPPRKDKIRFGSVSTLHPREENALFIEAFAEEFGNKSDVELCLHANDDPHNALGALHKHVQALGCHNIHLTSTPLTDDQKIEFLQDIDIHFCASTGEAYPLKPCEALALGKPTIHFDIGGYREIPALSGIFKIPASLPVVARYPEIKDQYFGLRQKPSATAIRTKLREAYGFMLSGQACQTSFNRRKFASQYSLRDRGENYAEFIYPDLNAGKKGASRIVSPSVAKRIEPHIGKHFSNARFAYKKIVPGHDGGLFSLFNSFMSKMVWDLKRNRFLHVLPDWNWHRLKRFHAGNDLREFCYGGPNDGNIWLKIFNPLYGLTSEDMNDEKQLYKCAYVDEVDWNYSREPFYSHVNAFALYQADWFRSWRRLYHEYFSSYVSLLPEYQTEIDAFRHVQTGKFWIAAHVRHPGHSDEQPDLAVANAQYYIENVYKQLNQRGILKDAWQVFLATDQERVVQQFQKEFGDRVFYFPDVRRTSLEQDLKFDKLPYHEKVKSGHQLHQSLARNPDSLSPKLGWEIVRDCIAMASCDVLLHVVSNVSTAVSYMNPDLEMVYCKRTA